MKSRRMVPLVLAAAVAASVVAVPVQEWDRRATASNEEPPHILVFTKTAGFRHASIETGVEALRKLGAEHGFTLDHSEDSDAFVVDNLAKYDAVVFLSTTGDILNDGQQEAFERYIEGGGGYVGIHAASDTEYDWPWYAELVGAYFSGHPAIQDATIHVEDREHISTKHLPESWERRDEWYNFRTNPRKRDGIRILAALDESTYEGGTMGDDHPIAWCHEVKGGRAWYTAGGHTKESFAEPAFLQHIAGGIRWAAGRAPAEATKSDD